MSLRILLALAFFSHTAFAVPAYQSGTFVWLGGPPGGIGYDIRVNPSDGNIWYVTDVGAGSAKSADGGATWTPSNFGMSDTAIFSTTIDPHDDNNIWSGTFVTGRLWKSIDGATTWVEASNGINPQNRSIRGITVDPINPNVIYLGVEVGGLESCVGAGTKAEVYKSVNDGDTWEIILGVDEPLNQNMARYVLVDPDDTQRIYVSTGLFDRAACDKNVAYHLGAQDTDLGGSAILRSNNGGATWEKIDPAVSQSVTGGSFVPSLLMHPTNSSILLAAVLTSRDAGDGVYKSVDGGGTWTRVLAVARNKTIHAVEIATANTNYWYAGGEGTFWYSTDAGVNWSQPIDIWAGRPVGFPIDIQTHPDDPETVLINSYGGGNVKSSDHGQTWTDASKGYTGAFIRGIFVHPTDWRKISPMSDDGGATWFSPKDNEDKPVANCIFIPPAQANDPYVRVGVGGDRSWRSIDDGVTWTAYSLLPGGGEFFSQPGYLVSAATEPNTIFATGSIDACGKDGDTGWTTSCAPVRAQGLSTMPGILRSLDGGVTWTKLRDIQKEGSKLTDFDDYPMLGFAVSPSDKNWILATSVAGLYESKDKGESWSKVTSITTKVDAIHGASSPADPDVYLWVAFDPSSATRIYVSNRHVPILRSGDSGATWEAAHTGIAVGQIVNKLAVDPVNAGVVYAATFSDALYTTNYGAQWFELDGIPSDNPSFSKRQGVFGLGISGDGSVLYAGSRGSGIYRLGTGPDVIPEDDGAPTDDDDGAPTDDDDGAPTDDDDDAPIDDDDDAPIDDDDDAPIDDDDGGPVAGGDTAQAQTTLSKKGCADCNTTGDLPIFGLSALLFASHLRRKKTFAFTASYPTRSGRAPRGATTRSPASPDSHGAARRGRLVWPWCPGRCPWRRWRPARRCCRSARPASSPLRTGRWRRGRSAPCAHRTPRRARGVPRSARRADPPGPAPFP